MNFKTAYKEANSRISADKDIIDGLFEKQNKRSVKPLLTVASMAAAAAVIALSVNIFPISPVETPENPKKIAMEQENPGKMARMYSDENFDASSGSKELAEICDTEIALNINYTQSLPGNTALITAESAYEWEITQEEYYEYLGVDIPKIAGDISGWSQLEFDARYVSLDEMGNMLSDKAYVTYISPQGKTLTAETSKLESLTPKGEYQKTDIAGNEATVFSDGTDYKVYLNISGAEISVSSQGLSEEEIKDLIKLIRK